MALVRVHISAKWSNLNITTTILLLLHLQLQQQLKKMGSWPWPFGVTWRHRSHDHSTRGGRLLIWVVYCGHASIWHRYRDMALQSTCTRKHRTTNRATNLLISSNVHYVYLGRDNNQQNLVPYFQIVVNTNHNNI